VVRANLIFQKRVPAKFERESTENNRPLLAEMSHRIVFGFAAVAGSAHAALRSNITISQNRGEASAREPRTYHGRGFSLWPPQVPALTPSGLGQVRRCAFCGPLLTSQKKRKILPLSARASPRIGRAPACVETRVPGQPLPRVRIAASAPEDQIAKASSDPTRNDFGSKRHRGSNLSLTDNPRYSAVDQKSQLGKIGGLGTAKWVTSRQT